MSHHQHHDGEPDINHVSKEELMQVPGIGEETAEHIIQHRPYNNATDLHWLFQVDDKRIKHLKEALRIPGEGPSGPAPTQSRQA